MDSTTFTLTGQRAALYWSYHQAAVLGSWTVSGLNLTASVTSVNEALMSQPSALTFKVHREHTAPWVWRVESLQMTNGTITARLKE